MTNDARLSLEGLIAQREARRPRGRAAQAEAAARKAREMQRFREALEAHPLTDAEREAIMRKIAAFSRGEPELVLFTFPSDFCTDTGRRIASRLDDWAATAPGAAREVHDVCRESLRPRGFGLGARIMDYPGGMPGDVGLVFSGPKELEG